MHLHTNMIVIVGILLLVSISARAQEVESKGELRVYPRETQVGTIANRQFKDNKGRVTKVIYYTYAGDFKHNFREELLREQSSRIYEYDEHGCPVKSEGFDQLHNSTGTEEVQCVAGTVTPSLITVRNTSGIKQRVTMNSADKQAILQFDSKGENVIGISGAMPSDIDLIHGWGNVTNGLALGIAPNRESGPQQEVVVYVSVKNIDHDSSIVMVSPILIELKDADGQVIQDNPVRAATSTQSESTSECPTYLQLQAPGSGRVLIQYSFSLGERYNPLPPGRYSLTLTYCMSDVPERLVSNMIQLEIK